MTRTCLKHVYILYCLPSMMSNRCCAITRWCIVGCRKCIVSCLLKARLQTVLKSSALTVTLGSVCTLEIDARAFFNIDYTIMQVKSSSPHTLLQDTLTLLKHTFTHSRCRYFMSWLEMPRGSWTSLLAAPELHNWIIINSSSRRLWSTHTHTHRELLKTKYA